MCGHGTIGLVKTLEYLGKIQSGTHKIETPVGNIDATLNTDGSVTITNVHSYRMAKDVEVDVEILELSRRYRVGWKLVLSHRRSSAAYRVL
jgi:Proline racemase